MTGGEVINIIRLELSELQKRFGVESIGLFGSYARGTQNEQSDLDFFVEVKAPLAKNYFELWDYLEKKFDKKVDLVRNGAHLREKFTKAIAREIIYA